MSLRVPALVSYFPDGWPSENVLDLEGGFRKYNQEFTPDGKVRAKPGVWKDSGPITWTDS